MIHICQTKDIFLEKNTLNKSHKIILT